MECTVCRTDLEECACADLDERMRALSGSGGMIAARWCARCDHHYARCICGEPVWRLRVDGALIQHPSLKAFQ